MKKTYEQLVEQIETALKRVGPYSHNIISLSLRQIADQFGTEKANQLIDDFNLEEQGWSKEK